MEFKVSAKSTPAVTTTESKSSAHWCFYNRTPSGSVTLQQFEVYAVERLKVLKAIELNNVLHGKSNGEQDDSLKTQLDSIGWTFLHKPGAGGVSMHDHHVMRMTLQLQMNKESEEKDFISHHILRLAYAKSEAKRQWFVNHEVELMKLRMNWNKHLLNRVLAHNHFDYEAVPDDEIKDLYEEINSCRTGHPNTAIQYYKVDFQEVLQLVSIRKVYLSQGYAYLPETDLNSFILNKYRMYLKEQLAVICKHLPGLEEENRIMRSLQALSGGDLGNSYASSKVSGEKITAAMLESLSQESYPLCMQMLHNHLKAKHHLKHDGRMQYGLFLKGMGVSLEESLKFWRMMFSKGGVDNDKFDKNYAYNIRHNYGKEGKRTDYTPYSCMKIIGRSEPKGDECHGCPFKHSDSMGLKQMLDKKRVPVDKVEEILGLKKQGHYQIACMTLFKATHPQADGLVEGLQHPNQYFEESRAILTGENNPAVAKRADNSKSSTLTSPSVRTRTSMGDKENLEDFGEEFNEDMEM